MLSFARLFNGRPLQYLWRDATGTTHIVHQGEGGEQGDPLMPLLYSVGQHRALEAISGELLASEKLLAYLDYTYVITKPDRVYTAVRQNLWIHACVSINHGKTKVWNAARHKPAACEVLDRVAQAEDPDAMLVPPDLVAGFARAHDARLWSCLFHILGIAEDTCDDVARATASLPLAMGGLGLRSAARTSPPAFWASWADCLPMVQKRHPEVATHIVEMLSNHPSTPCLEAAVQAAEGLHALPGFTPPSWLELALGTRPPQREPEENEPGTSPTRWQHEVSSRTERQHRDRLFTTMSDSERAMVRQVLRRGSAHPFSALFSCGVFVSHSLCPSASAGVAVHSTLVATTGQLVRGLGCWEGEDSRKRAPPRECVEREERA